MQKQLGWVFLPNLQFLRRFALHPGQVPQYRRGEGTAECSLLLHFWME